MRPPRQSKQKPHHTILQQGLHRIHIDKIAHAMARLRIPNRDTPQKESRKARKRKQDKPTREPETDIENKKNAQQELRCNQKPCSHRAQIKIGETEREQI
jgi:hypothetical protein